MIKVVRLDDSVFYLNPHQIESLESTPDTVITMINGKTLVVKNKIQELIKSIFEYRRSLGGTFAGNED
jgi:flagellar protein FlbD